MEVDLFDSTTVETKHKDNWPAENELNVMEVGVKGEKKENAIAGEDAGNPNTQVIFFSFNVDKFWSLKGGIVG